MLAHRFFSEQAREWLNENGAEAVQIRATTIERVVRELLQIVVIDPKRRTGMFTIFEMVTPNWNGPDCCPRCTMLSSQLAHCANATRFKMWGVRTAKNSTSMRS